MEVSIDVVIIQCDIPIDVLDTEKNSAVVSFTKASNTNEILATFRCQSSTTSLSVRIRSVEGQNGLLRAYVIFKMNPKSCLLKTYPIKPLSLHKRCHRSVIVSKSNTGTGLKSDTGSGLKSDTGTGAKSETGSGQEVNKLEIIGDFSILQAHSWLQSCLPEFPEKLPENSQKLGTFQFHFVSTLTKSGLDVNVSKGRISFESDNISTVSILKDFITREATNSSIRIEVDTGISEGTIFDTLKSLYPIVRKVVREKEVSKLKEAIVTEIIPSDSVVGQEMLDELDRSDLDDRNESEIIDLSFDRIVGLIVDLFIDYHKVKGRASKSTLNEIKGRIPGLISLLDSVIINGMDTIGPDEFVTRLITFYGMKQTFFS